jgi:hypothetical protein
MKNTIKIGDKVVFDPLEGIKHPGFGDREAVEVEGIVRLINEDHHWFMAEYFPDGVHKVRICFNFSDIGDIVKKVE